MNTTEQIVDAFLTDTLSSEDADQLVAWLTSNTQHIDLFVEQTYLDSLLRDVVGEKSRRNNIVKNAIGRRDRSPSTSPTIGFFRSTGTLLLHPATFCSLLVLAVCMLAYMFWPSAGEPPVVKQTPVRVLSAKIANLTDAKWAGASAQAGDTLKAGQQLLLQSGSAEITFNDHARVMLQGPAEFVVVDAGACRLTTGRLTAHVPDLAKGFKVHTPDGTVTDLGTEFGVYVNTGVDDPLLADAYQEQQPGGGPQFDSKQPPITEVHVFKGQVDVMPGDELAQAPTNQKSTILQAGQAVTISDNKVQPLPAADPFKFALDKLNGRPRTILLSEDFETYDVGDRVQAIGPWTVQSGTRRGQGIRILDAPDLLSQYKTDAGDPYPNLTPSPPTGGRFVFIACASPNRPETFPILAREIDGKLLARNGQVLIEFDILQNSLGAFEPSLALAAKVEHTAGIELGRNAEGKKIEWLPYQCYRLRLLLDVMDGTVRGVRADRLHWRGPQGWVRDLTFVPAAKFDWSTPPRYVIFGFPVVSGTTPVNIFWLDNVRIEVISEK